MSTIYEYNSGLWSGTNPAPELFGTHITGSVEFAFDATNVTGTFFARDGLVSNINVEFGIYKMNVLPNATWFELSHGSLIHWWVNADFFGCGNASSPAPCSLAMRFTELPMTDGTYVQQICSFVACLGAPGGASPGSWHAAAVPAGDLE